MPTQGLLQAPFGAEAGGKALFTSTQSVGSPGSTIDTGLGTVNHVLAQPADINFTQIPANAGAGSIPVATSEVKSAGTVVVTLAQIQGGQGQGATVNQINGSTDVTLFAVGGRPVHNA